jgi:hypothetical protein
MQMKVVRKTPLLAGAAALALALVAAPAAQAETELAAAPDERIAVDVVTVNGSGCPQGTADVTVSGDNTSFSVSYSHFQAQAGGGGDIVESRKNCQINLAVDVPSGFTFAVARADYRGFAHLESGATGMQKASYYFSGSSATVGSAHQLGAPYSGDWHFTDQAAGLIYKPCGEQRNFNINAELRVGAGSDPARTSFITMDSTRGDVETVFHLAWKRC